MSSNAKCEAAFGKAVLVVLNYNDSETTKAFLERVKNYKNLCGIVAVDNCSTDGSYEELCGCKSDLVHVIRTEANDGYAAGNNYGIRYALEQFAPDYVIVSNPDVEFEASVVDTLVKYAVKFPSLGMITCRMHCTSGIPSPVAWRLPGYWDCILENLILLKTILKKIKRSDREPLEYSPEYLAEGVCPVDCVPGSFFMISVEAYNAVGGFDEETFLYYEENIMSFKLKESSYVNYITCDASYIHRHSVSINKSLGSVKRKLEEACRSRKIYCRKYLKVNPGKMWWLKITFWIGLYDYMAAVKLLGRTGRKN